jgi:hypothetical protein
MNTFRQENLNVHSAGLDRLPTRYESLPGQMELFGDGDDEARQTDPFGDLFETGRDLPGARERKQTIIWDLEA